MELRAFIIKPDSINTVNTDTHPEPAFHQLPEAARETARRTADAAAETAKRATETAKDVADEVDEITTDATKHAVKHATDSAKDMYQSAKHQAEDKLAISKEYVRRNPVPVVLGAIAFGAAIGYMLMRARRRPTFGERYAEEPMVAVREAIRGAFAPVAHRVHSGYDSAMDGAGRAIDRVHRLGSGHTRNSISDRIGRIGNNLKFW